MQVLMLGWEFPPYFAGGVGVACEALSRALVAQGHKLTYIMPRGPKPSGSKDNTAAHMDVLIAEHFAGHIRFETIDSLLSPYFSEDAYANAIEELTETDGLDVGTLYGPNLLAEVERFAAQVSWLVRKKRIEFDVIHAHDWTTFPAGARLKAETGKPLLSHVHITEFDKSGGDHADSRVYAIERAGMHSADHVIAVSRFTRQRCIERYGCDPSRVSVVYNGIDARALKSLRRQKRPASSPKTVLFLGRMTLQKGPDHFLRAAKRVVDFNPNVRFIMAGTGDMLLHLVDEAARLGIGANVLFTGFASRQDAMDLYASADAFVMPSVSEPFGIVPLEAMARHVPVIVSRQSGVSEVLSHALKVDFWDVEDLASKILSVLSYPALSRTLAQEGQREVESLTWDKAAEATTRLYQEVARLKRAAHPRPAHAPAAQWSLPC